MKQQGTVYVVDDDPDMRNSLRWLIESIGLEVKAFDSGEAFIGFAPLSRPACILLDIRMPGMGGVRMLDQLSRQASPPPAINLTGHGEIPMAVQTMKLGAFDFLEKPTSPHELLERIQDALIHDARNQTRGRDHSEFGHCLENLTPREKQILDRLAEGNSTREVAECLFISERTVEKHRERLLEKTQTKSMVDLIRRLLEFRQQR